MGRNNFLPWLDARFESAPSGGTILAGTIGPGPGSPGFITAFAVISVFMAAAGIIAGTAALAATGSPGALPVLLIPLSIGIIGIMVVISNRRALPQHISALVQEVNDILDSAATM
jgi:hypothetical protein